MENKQELTRGYVEQQFNKILNCDFERGVSSVSWMGIEISWQRKPKYIGGNILRGKTWGVWEYHDCLNGKELTREQAINTILIPFDKRYNKADLVNIKYCASCGNIAVGEKEQEQWGLLNIFTGWTVYINKETGKESYRIANHEWKHICYKCCKNILNRGVTNG